MLLKRFDDRTNGSPEGVPFVKYIVFACSRICFISARCVVKLCFFCGFDVQEAAQTHLKWTLIVELLWLMVVGGVHGIFLWLCRHSKDVQRLSKQCRGKTHLPYTGQVRRQVSQSRPKPWKGELKFCDCVSAIDILVGTVIRLAIIFILFSACCVFPSESSLNMARLWAYARKPVSLCSMTTHYTSIRIGFHAKMHERKAKYRNGETLLTGCRALLLTCEELRMLEVPKAQALIWSCYTSTRSCSMFRKRSGFWEMCGDLLDWSGQVADRLFCTAFGFRGM